MSEDVQVTERHGLVRRLWAEERVRFLVIGGTNTVVGYAIYAGLTLAIGRAQLPPVLVALISLFASYLPSTLVAFILHRRFTFRLVGRESLVLDYLRFNLVYLVGLAVNAPLLAAFVQYLRLEPLLAQAIVIVITTVLSYVGHKFFSFRRKKPVEPAPGD